MLDSSGHGYNGTNNGATLTPDRYAIANQALSFNGTNNYVDCGDVLNPGMGDFSIAFWMKTTDATGTVISKDGGGANYRFVLSEGWNGNCLFWFQDAARSGSAYVYAGYVPTDGNWHHIVAVLNRSQHTIKSYCDGVFWNTRPLDAGFLDGTITNSSSLYIGTATFNGLLDDVRIYSRTLTQADITELYNNDLSRSTLRNAVIRNAVIR